MRIRGRRRGGSWDPALRAFVLTALACATAAASSFETLSRRADSETNMKRLFTLRRKAIGAWRRGDSVTTLARNYASLCALHYDRRELFKALKYGKKAVKYDPKNGTAWLNLGATQLSLHRIRQGIRSEREALRINKPGYRFQVNANLCEGWMRWGDFGRAEKHCKRSLAVARHRPEPYIDRARFHLGRGKPELALKDCARARKRIEAGVSSRNVPNGATVKTIRASIEWVRGEALLAQGRHDDALKAFELSLRHNPREIWAYRGKARVYAATDRPMRAIQEYSRALDTDMDFLEAYIERGAIYSGIGERDAAEEDFRQALKITSHPEAYYRRGLHRMAGRDAERALEDFERSLKRRGSYAPALLARGEARKALGMREEAAKDFASACRKGLSEACSRVEPR